MTRRDEEEIKKMEPLRLLRGEKGLAVGQRKKVFTCVFIDMFGSVKAWPFSFFFSWVKINATAVTFLYFEKS